MKTVANVLVKNEGTLLKEILKFWKDYPVDEFLFWNDNSTDDTVEVINSFLKGRSKIFDSNTKELNEASGRNFLATKSVESKADIIFSLDCDELFSYSLLNNFNELCQASEKYNIGLFQCNVVDSLNYMRTDPKYKDNYRFFVIPTKHMQLLPQKEDGIHVSEREPFVNLPKVITKDLAFIHLQAINRKFYAYKQVFYKIDQITRKRGNYTKVIQDITETCNGLVFNEVQTPIEYVNDWKFNPIIFDTIAEERKYKEIIETYIKNGGESFIVNEALNYL